MQFADNAGPDQPVQLCSLTRAFVSRLVEAALTSTHNLCFEQKYEKYQNILSVNFQFLEVKFLVYFNRCVFVMDCTDAHAGLGLQCLLMAWGPENHMTALALAFDISKKGSGCYPTGEDKQQAVDNL